MRTPHWLNGSGKLRLGVPAISPISGSSLPIMCSARYLPEIVPFAIPASLLETAQLICAAGMARVDPLFEKHVGLVLQGTLPSRERVIADFVAPLSERIEQLGSRVAGVEFVTETRDEPYGRFAVFLDIAGNRWDLIGPAR